MAFEHDADLSTTAPTDAAEIRLAQPASWPARLILAALGLFCVAGVLTWTPLDLPTPLSRVAYFVAAGTVLAVGAILPLYAALSGEDAVWRLRPGLLTVELTRPFWRRTLHVTGADIAAISVELAAANGPERVVVKLDLRDRPPLISPSFDDPLDAEWFADALAAALDVAAPANLIPPGMAPRRRWSPWPGRRRETPPDMRPPATPFLAVPAATDDGPDLPSSPDTP